MKNKTKKQKTKWIMADRIDKMSKIRLFCFTYAGGGASTYISWKERFPKEIEVCPIQYPGHENRIGEPLHDNIYQLVDELENGISHLFDKPFVFFGHSMGAQIAFELACQIKRTQHKEPLHFIVSACTAPHLTSPEFTIRNLPDNEFLARIKCLGGMPDTFLNNKELLELYLPVLRADFQMTETYHVSMDNPLGCPITAFCGTRDTRYNSELIKPWEKQTTNSFDLHMIEGDHFYIHSNHNKLTGMVRDALNHRIL